MPISQAEVVNSPEEMLAGISFVSGVPVGEIAGYIVLTFVGDKGPKVDTSACCVPHLVSLLTDVIANTCAALAVHPEAAEAG